MSQSKPNQHYIPQSLIKQFSIGGKKKQVYWYRGEKTTINSVNGVFAERYYYGREESSDFADDIITNGENTFVNNLLPYLIQQKGLIDNNRIQTADFIAHFLLRRSLNRNLFLRTAEDYDTSEIDISFIDDTLESLENKPLNIRVIQQEYLLRIIIITPFIFKYLVGVLKAFMPESSMNSLTNDRTQKAFKDECRGRNSQQNYYCKGKS